MLLSVVERLSGKVLLAASTDMQLAGVKGLPEFPKPTYPPTRLELSRAVGRRAIKEVVSIGKRGLLLPLMPERMYRKRKLVNGNRMVALLDCSGFAYGDQWRPGRMQARTHYYRRLKDRGLRLIMLPQALGSFDNEELKEPARELFAQFDRIYARDEFSKAHVLSLGVEPAKVTAVPDITHLLDAPEPAQAEQWHKRVAIVPNARMQDKTDAAVGARYIGFLTMCVQRVRAHGLEPVILVHEVNDDKVVEQLFRALGGKLQIFDEDGLTSKGLLRCCYANIGSRYHSLVSSLSQGVPSLGTFWSHKYKALFHEYGCEDCLISPAAEDGEVLRRLDQFLAPASNATLRPLLQAHAHQQKVKVEAMWQEVEAIIS